MAAAENVIFRETETFANVFLDTVRNLMELQCGADAPLVFRAHVRDIDRILANMFVENDEIVGMDVKCCVIDCEWCFAFPLSIVFLI